MRLSLFLALACSLSQAALVYTAPKADYTLTAEDRSAIAEAREITSNLDIRALQNDARDIAHRVQEMREKGPNRLFFSAAGIGLYGRDIPELATLGASLAADVFLYRSIKQARISHIIESIEQDLDGFQQALVSSWQQQFALEQEYNNRSWLSRTFTSKAAQLYAIHKPIVDYINERHVYIHYNPFKRDLLMPLALYIACDKVCNAITNATQPSMSLPRAYQPAYTVDKDGNYIQTDHISTPIGVATQVSNYLEHCATGKERECDWRTAPISVSGLTKLTLFFLNPWRMWKAFGQNDPEQSMTIIRWGNRLLGLNIPPALLSPTAAFAYECLGIAFSAQIFNDMHHALWVRECIEQRSRLSGLIDAMIAARDSGADEDTYLRARENLEQFIEEVHLDKSWYPLPFFRRWSESLSLGVNKVYRIPLLVIGGIAGYRIGKFIYSLVKP